jgi:hypothetical protein
VKVMQKEEERDAMQRREKESWLAFGFSSKN